MFNLIQAIKRKLNPPPSERIQYQNMMAKDVCPVCLQTAEFYGGPEGGAGQNLYCSECGTVFTYCLGFGVEIVERYGKAEEVKQWKQERNDSENSY